MVNLSHLSFVVYGLVTVSADVLPFLESKQYEDGDWGNYPAQSFLSDHEVIAPVPNIIKDAHEGISPNQYYTWAPTGPNIPLTGPQLLDAETLAVTYQAPLFGPDNFGLSVQRCNNTDYLVWWSGESIAGRAAGQYHILNTNYENLWNVTAIGLKYADAHDLFLTPRCTAVFTVNEPRPFDMAEFGVDNGVDQGWIMESYIQEVDLATNKLIFQWRASDHVDIHDSFWKPGIRGHNQRLQGWDITESWDFFHINSVQKDFQGNYLISARHYHSLYYLDGRTGSIIWTLGGKKNDFTDLSNGEATNFAWQHHARWASEDLTLISVFDDRNCRYIKSEDPVSRGLVLKLNHTMKSVEATSYKATSLIQSFRKGGMHYLENGNALVGYGNEPGFTEFSPNGTVLFDVRFGPIGLDRDTADNYRSLKVNWTGNPTWNPKISAGPFLQDYDRLVGPGISKDLPLRPNNTVYFSWNGATKLAKWTILASNDTIRLNSIKQIWCEVSKTGFETSFEVGESARYIRAIAVSAEDEIMSASPVLDMKTGKTVEQPWDSIDFVSQLKKEQEQAEHNELEKEELEAQHEAEQQSLESSKSTFLIGVIIGGFLATVVLVAALTWRHRAISTEVFRRTEEGHDIDSGSSQLPRADYFEIGSDAGDIDEERVGFLSSDHPTCDGDRGLSRI